MRTVIAFLLTISAAFGRVGESDAEFRKRFDDPPDKIEKFDNGVIRSCFRSINGRPRVVAFSINGMIARLEYYGASSGDAGSIREAQEAEWTGYASGRRQWWVSKTGLRAEFTPDAFIIADPRRHSLLRESMKQRPAATVVPG